MRIDLSRGKIEHEHLSSDYLESWIGGRGFNVNVFSEETKADLDPYDPKTAFCLAVGPLTGTCAPCAAITSVASKSPMLAPQTYATSSMGGHWGAELKFTGSDQIVIRGQAEHPTYIWIHDNDVELRDATDLWGKDTHQTTVLIQEELKDRTVQVLCIGPAGERLVRYASLVNAFHWDSGRLGLGAVMGSKNLKAVAVRGSRSASLHDPEHLAAVCKGLIHKIQGDSRTQALSFEGTLFVLKEHQGQSPGGPFQDINSRYYRKNYFFSKQGCFACPIHCGRYTHVKSGPYEGIHFGGAHGESVRALGPEMGIARWDSILKMIQMCILYGLDPVSTGGTIAWAMRTFDKGLFREHETDDIPLHWGNAEGAVKLIEKIAKREGSGDTLAEGALRASEIVGRQSEELVAHVKGLELVGLKDMRMNSALHAAVSTGDWDNLKKVIGLSGDMRHEHNTRKKQGQSESGVNPQPNIDTIAHIVKRTEDVKCAADLAGVCSFPYARLPVLNPADLIEQLSAVADLGLDEEALINASEKVIADERRLAAREGVSRADEERFPMDRLHTGDSERAGCSHQEWRTMLSRYYALRDWESETGLPKNNSRMRETSEVLEISEV